MRELKLILQSDLCAGSGEATGMTVDSDICIDDYGFPYIPARRLKGVLRDAADMLCAGGATNKEQVNTLFGVGENAGLFRITDAVLPGIESLRACAADAPKCLERAAAPLNISRLFTSIRGQTALENGVAKKGALRYTRVLDRHNALHPGQATELTAQVELKADANKELFRLCCKAVRHIGSDRNRGLGNVRLELSEENAAGKGFQPPSVPKEGDCFRICYTLELTDPVTLPGCAEMLDEIPARSVIGCLASQYGADTDGFADLFLNGTVRWSALTPRICDARSIPAPLSLVRLKDEGIYVNRATADPGVLMGKKSKTVDGCYLALTKQKDRNEPVARVAKANSHTVYHHSNRSRTLYMQESLDAGMLYSGVVDVPRSLAETVLKLLCSARFSFGRSKTAQYGRCVLAEQPGIEAIANPELKLTAGTPVWVLLESDLVLSKNGVYITDPASVRTMLAEALHLEDRLPDGQKDYCQSRILGGYQAMWNLPKMQIPATRGGSLFAFCAGGEPVADIRQLGEFSQEGMGSFRVLTEDKLKDYDGAQKGRVDRRAPIDGAEAAALRKAMASAELERVFGEEVSELYRKTARRAKDAPQEVRKGTLGRMRQMITDAKDYNDFLKRVRSIKASDVHSDNLEPDRDKALKLAGAVWNCTCNKYRDLLALVGGDSTKLWKKPMQQMIHLLYYGK